jgi:hypothetical protein
MRTIGVYSKYRIEFGCVDGRMGAYLGDTVEQVHLAIDRDPQLRPWEADALKYGYFKEFEGNPYKTQDYVIDNGIHFMWIVGGIREKEKPKNRSLISVLFGSKGVE